MLRVGEDFQELVLSGQAPDGSAKGLGDFTSLDAQLSRDTGRSISVGDVAETLESQWREYSKGMFDGVFSLTEDAATDGNPAEDTQCYAWQSVRRGHAFWLIPQARASKTGFSHTHALQ